MFSTQYFFLFSPYNFYSDLKRPDAIHVPLQSIHQKASDMICLKYDSQQNTKNHRMFPITYTKTLNSFMWYKESAMIWTLTFFSFMLLHISITIYIPLLQNAICISPSLFDVLHFYDIEHAFHYA